MKFMFNDKDGGKDSLVWCFGFESKSFGSLMLLNFKKGSRNAYHSHAFDAISLVLKGQVEENILGEDGTTVYKASFKPIVTKKETFHKVVGMVDDTWILTLRGRWNDTWFEENEHGHQTLTHGRKVVYEQGDENETK